MPTRRESRLGRAAIATLLIAALPAQADVDAGTELPPAVYGERAQVLIPGGNWEEFEAPGAWLPLLRLMAEGRELARLRAENAKLLEETPLFSRAALVTMAIVSGLVLVAGVYLGWSLRGLLKGL